MSLLMSYPNDFDLFRSPFEKLISDMKLPRKYEGTHIGDKTVYEYEVPGASVDNTKVVLKDHKIIIDASRKSELSSSGKNNDELNNSTSYNKKIASYHFELSVDRNVKSQDIRYNIADGILTLTVNDVDESPDGEIILPDSENLVGTTD